MNPAMPYLYMFGLMIFLTMLATCVAMIQP